MSEEKFEFKVGDFVDDHGIEGKVTSVNFEAGTRPVIAKFSDGGVTCYTIDGKRHNNQTRPSLKLVERPVKFEPFEMWANIYDGVCRIHSEKESASRCSPPSKIEMVKLVFHPNADGTIKNVEVVR